MVNCVSLSKTIYSDNRIAKRCNIVLDKITKNPGTNLSTLFDISADSVDV